MSSPARRKELDALHEAENEARSKKEWRVSNMSIDEYIDNSQIGEETARVLRRIAQIAGVDIYREEIGCK